MQELEPGDLRQVDLRDLSGTRTLPDLGTSDEPGIWCGWRYDGSRKSPVEKDQSARRSQDHLLTRATTTKANVNNIEITDVRIACEWLPAYKGTVTMANGQTMNITRQTSGMEILRWLRAEQHLNSLP